MYMYMYTCIYPQIAMYSVDLLFREVSVMLVKTTTFLPMAPFGLFGGGDSKILCWRLGGSVEYSGMHLHEISHFRSQVLHLTLDAFASLFNLLNKVFIHTLSAKVLLIFKYTCS